MNPLKPILFFCLFASSMFAQEEKITIADRLYNGDMSSTCYFIKGKVAWSPSNPLYGIQFKREKSDNEAGVFTFMTGQTFAVNYTRLNDRNLINASLETHFRSYPLTAGMIRIGAGVDYTTNFQETNYFSIYPSLGLDIGGVEIIYSYLINGYKSAEFSDHRITLAVGLWVKRKKN